MHTTAAKIAALSNPYQYCNLVDSNQSGFSTGVDSASAESNDCANNYFGNPSNPVNTGTSTNPILQLLASGGNYATRSMNSVQNGMCSTGRYNRNYSNSSYTMQTWDRDNTN